MNEKNIDELGKTPGSPSGTEEGIDPGSSAGSEEEKLPFDQHPKWQEASKTAKALSEFMEEHEVDSLEELGEILIEHGVIKGKVKNLDLDEILEKAQTFDKYTSYWASQEEVAKREGESPEDTIKRLEQKITGLESERVQAANTSEASKEAQRNLDAFSTTVTSLIGEQEDLPKSQKQFLGMFLGIGNPALDVDITNKKAVKKMAQGGIKQYRDFVNSILKDFQDGKLKIPVITKPDETPVPKDKEVKTLKDARKVAAEILTGKLFKSGAG